MADIPTVEFSGVLRAAPFTPLSGTMGFRLSARHYLILADGAGATVTVRGNQKRSLPYKDLAVVMNDYALVGLAVVGPLDPSVFEGTLTVTGGTPVGVVVKL